MIEWLIANCPRPSIVRALEANKVEFLGGFNLIPPSNLPGWIFRVITLAATERDVCILANDKEHKYEIRIVKGVPWKHWQGMFGGILLVNRLNSGDHPLRYKEYWNAAKSSRPTKDE